MALRIQLNGARGRMGRAVAAAAADMGVVIGASTDIGDSVAACHGVRRRRRRLPRPAREVSHALLERAVAASRPVKSIGTTGHPAAEKAALLKLAARVPCVWAGNFSVGVNLLFSLTRRAARALDDDFAAEIVEMHHRMKKDAPSGTAIRLLEIILEERRLGRGAVRHGREGITGERPPGEVAVHSLRGGDVVGDHTVIFAGHRRAPRADAQGERPRPSSRAAPSGPPSGWRARSPGVYDMQDGARPRLEAPPDDHLDPGNPRRGPRLLRAVVEVSAPELRGQRARDDRGALASAGSAVKLHTLVVYREDSQALYGFADAGGPRLLPADDRERDGNRPEGGAFDHEPPVAAASPGAIRSGDVATLSKCPGIGKKAAERLVVELKARVGAGGAAVTAVLASGVSGVDRSPHADAVAALVALGYKVGDADEAVRRASLALGDSATTEAMIRKALG